MNSSGIDPALCESALNTFQRNVLANHLSLALLTICLLCLLLLLFRYWRNPIAVHGNLLLLFGNILALCFLNSLVFFIVYLRYLVLFLSYKDGCDLLTPLWFIALTIGPSYIYSFGYPAFHFCVMLERVRATFMADKYEGTGQSLGIRMAIGIWLLSLGYMAFVIVAAYLDPAMTAQSLAIVSITSKYNGPPLLYANIFFTLLIIFTAICAWRVTVENRRIRKLRLNYLNYSLSRNYQLNENALVMRLILPLDIFYALLYTIYQAIAIAIRASKPYITQYDYSYYFTLANMLLFFYSMVTSIVYFRSLGYISQCQKRTVVETTPAPEHATIYFKQLSTQWE